MNNQIILALHRKLENIAASGPMDAETQRNVVKEELQFYVLNFICHHPEYNKWTMYGGSALRICHDLDRMSVDLDFEVAHAITQEFLETLSKNLEEHFVNTYGTSSESLTIKITTGRGLLLRFYLGTELGINHPSNQIHLKVDLNHFRAPNEVVERIPTNRGQLSFVIRTYNMATLMASKIAAIYLRGKRGVGPAVYEEKGRDIYDLLWYMSKKVVPDFGYLSEKKVDVEDPKGLFDELTIRMNKVSDENLKQDLAPLFLNRNYIENWLENWRESFLRLVEDYNIHNVTELKSIHVQQEFRTDIFYFGFVYDTADGDSVRFVFSLSDYWITFGGADLRIGSDESVTGLMTFGRDYTSTREVPEGLLQKYAYLFYCKVESYLGGSNRVLVGNEVRTKLIRMTADKLNQREQILLNKSALLSCKLQDLMK